jgi:hypothetical protein
MTGDVPEPQGSPREEKDLRSLVLDEALQLLQKGEQAKVEFKREPPEIAKLAKEIAAIANTDDEGGHYQNDSFRDYGFLIVGVENGRIVGYQTWESLGCRSEEEEKVKDCLVSKLKEYIAPLPGFSVFRFEAPETQVPFWVVLIYPSEEQPHVVLKDGNEVERHTVYVRKGSVTERASADDYARFLRQVADKAAKKAVELLENSVKGEVSDTRRRLERLERRFNDVEEMVKSLLHKFIDRGLDTLISSKGVIPSQRSGEALELNTSRSLEELARSLRLSHEDPIERALSDEIDNLRKYLGSLPWTLPSSEWQKTLEDIQEKTQPLLRGLGELVWADKEEKYAPIVGEALERLALASRRPAYVDSWTEGIEALRLYPLLLTVYHLGILAHFHGRPNYLRLLLTLQLPPPIADDENITALLPGLRNRFYSYTDQLFERLYPGRCMPLSWHLHNLLFVKPGVTKFNLPPRVREGGLLYSSPTDPEGTLATYLEGEFVLGLLALKPQLAIENPRPLLGLYAAASPALYLLKGPRLFARIKRLVTQPPAHLCQVLELSGKTLKEYLEALVRSISNMTLEGTCVSASGVYERLSQDQLGSCAQ